jgi:hypothetical protein
MERVKNDALDKRMNSNWEKIDASVDDTVADFSKLNENDLRNLTLGVSSPIFGIWEFGTTFAKYFQHFILPLADSTIHRILVVNLEELLSTTSCCFCPFFKRQNVTKMSIRMTTDNTIS